MALDTRAALQRPALTRPDGPLPEALEECVQRHPTAAPHRHRTTKVSHNATAATTKAPRATCLPQRGQAQSIPIGTGADPRAHTHASAQIPMFGLWWERLTPPPRGGGGGTQGGPPQAPSTQGGGGGAHIRRLSIRRSRPKLRISEVYPGPPHKYALQKENCVRRSKEELRIFVAHPRCLADRWGTRAKFAVHKGNCVWWQAQHPDHRGARAIGQFWQPRRTELECLHWLGGSEALSAHVSLHRHTTYNGSDASCAEGAAVGAAGQFAPYDASLTSTQKRHAQHPAQQGPEGQGTKTEWVSRACTVCV